MFSLSKTCIAVLAGVLVTTAVEAREFDFSMQLPAFDSYVPAMTADLDRCCDGTGIKSTGFLTSDESWSNTGTEIKRFSIVTSVVVPNSMEGFRTLEEALNADIRVTIARRPGEEIAECVLVTQPFDIGDPIHSRFGGFDPGGGADPIDQELYVVTYELELMQKGSTLVPIKGICNILVNEPPIGIVAGIPALETNDHVVVVNQMEGYRTHFLDGYCK